MHSQQNIKTLDVVFVFVEPYFVRCLRQIRLNFNPQAEIALESNCVPVSTLIVVRITIYTVMAFTLPITDFVEWL